MKRSIKILILILIPTMMQARPWLTPLRSIVASTWQRVSSRTPLRMMHSTTHSTSNALVPYRAPWYRRFGPYAAFGLASSAAMAYKSTKTVAPMQETPALTSAPQPKHNPEEYKQTIPVSCPKLPSLDVEDAPKPMSGSFSIYGKGLIKCDPENSGCMERLSLWSKYGTDFAQCIKKDSVRADDQPRTPECQGVFNILNLQFPETAQKRYPLTTLPNASCSVKPSNEPNKAYVAFHMKGKVACKEGDVQCNNALYLLSKTGSDFSKCTLQRTNNPEQKPEPTCYSLFNLLERSGPDVSILDHVPVTFDQFDVHVDVAKE